MKSAKFTLPCATALLFLATPGLTQDGGLYEDVADPNAAFVRVIATGETVAVVQSVAFRDVEDGITPYVVTDPGEVKIVAAGTEVAEMVEPATFYTYLVGPDGTGSLIEDDLTGNPAQADVTFYNLSDVEAVDLFVPQANAVAIPAVSTNSAATVALKAPLTLDFQMQSGDEMLAQVDAVDLKRRAGITIIFSGAGGVIPPRSRTIVTSIDAMARRNIRRQ
ncbi:MAG: hypothetical protein GKR99_12570 [Rhodobacteraceae bacterium]|nr:hypothetical protein [Paracoccaceae bacterium]